jgi:hypothetical protein
MNLKNSLIVLLVFIIAFTACKPDDPTFIPVPDRDRAEQQVVDNDSLIGYLETHYYNSAALSDAGADYTIDDIVITELPQDENGNYLDLPNPDDNTLLIDAVDTYERTYFDVVYQYYVLTINEGGSDYNPNFTDLVELVYSGNTQDENVFDSAINPNSPFDMIGLIEGWRQVIPKFKTASSFIINPDGTVEYTDYGIGVMFLPSGLAYFSNPPFGISVYSNLIFKFELYRAQENDHDFDGVPSQFEDINGNQEIGDDDTDGDTIPNFFDGDDDGDGVFTLFEDLDEDGDPTNDDSDGDGIPNYLDADSTESNQDDN